MVAASSIDLTFFCVRNDWPSIYVARLTSPKRHVFAIESPTTSVRYNYYRREHDQRFGSVPMTPRKAAGIVFVPRRKCRRSRRERLHLKVMPTTAVAAAIPCSEQYLRELVSAPRLSTPIGQATSYRVVVQQKSAIAIIMLKAETRFCENWCSFL